MRRKMAVLTIICLLTAGAGLWAQEGAELPRLAAAKFTPNISAAQINADVVTVRNLVESQMVLTWKYQMH